MRKLSFWAKHHAVSARIIIIISRSILLCIAYFLGMELFRSGVNLSPVWTYIFMIVFVATAAVYPKRLSKNYLKRKTCDLVIAACGFFLVICVVNQLNRPFSFYSTTHAAMVVDPSPYKYAEAKRLLEQFQKGEKTKFTSKEKRIIKNEFKHQLGQYVKAKVLGRKGEADQAALILLTCILAAGLLYLVAALACTLSCNGSDAAAIIVAVLGTVGVIWGAIAVIRSIRRKRSKTKT
jgi:hypothetical protein